MKISKANKEEAARIFEFVKELPKTISGKVIKKRMILKVTPQKISSILFSLTGNLLPALP